MYIIHPRRIMSDICIRIGQAPKSGIEGGIEAFDGRRCLVERSKIEPSKEGRGSTGTEYTNTFNGVLFNKTPISYTLAETIQCIQICIAPLSDVLGLAVKLHKQARVRVNSTDFYKTSLCNQVYWELASIRYIQHENTETVALDVFTRMARCRIPYFQDNKTTNRIEQMSVHPSDVYGFVKGMQSRNLEHTDTDSPSHSWFASGTFVFSNNYDAKFKHLWEHLENIASVFESINDAKKFFLKEKYILLDATSHTLHASKELKIDAKKVKTLETKNRCYIDSEQNSALFRVLIVLRDAAVSQLLSVKISSYLAVTIPESVMVNADVFELFEYHVNRFKIKGTFAKEYVSPFAELMKASLSRDKFLSLGAMRHRQSAAYDQAVTRCERQLMGTIKLFISSNPNLPSSAYLKC